MGIIFHRSLKGLKEMNSLWKKIFDPVMGRE
jgi:hypothetical protein